MSSPPPHKKAKLQPKSDQLINILSALSAKARYFAEGELSTSDIAVEVQEVGSLTFPLNDNSIKKLISISSKALFGLRDRTLLDENVRNTQEISSDKLKVTVSEQKMSKMLGEMRQKLGLPKNAVLTPHLHKLLVYSQGQFFEFHQDTEKQENMNATLSLVLPSPHMGGDLVISHGNKNHVFSSENYDFNNAIKCIAFYADCYHKIEKVRLGHRVVLTYNLVAGPTEIEIDKNRELRKAIEEYFEKGVSIDANPPKLVYFLCHSYTEKNLRWDRMKGADIANVSSFMSAARDLKLKHHLALVRIKRELSEEGGSDIEDKITVSYWIDSDGNKLPYGDWKFEYDEICWTTDTRYLDTIKSESYGGYMGNEGGTEKHWYRRAAVILWPESSQIAMNFALKFEDSLDELCSLLDDAENLAKVTEIVKSAGNFLHYGKCDEENFERFARIAVYLEGKETAMTLLTEFQWAVLNDILAAELLARLQTQFGVGFCIELLSQWEKNEIHKGRYTKVRVVLKDLDSFARNFLKNGGDTKTIELILDEQYQSLERNFGKSFCYWQSKSFKESNSERIELIYQFLIACEIISHVSAIDKTIHHLISKPECYPEIGLGELILRLKDESKDFAKYKALEDYVVKAIDELVALGPHSDSNWSFRIKPSCVCKHCKPIIDFLDSSTEVQKKFPMKYEHFKHAKYTFKSLYLPVGITDCYSNGVSSLIIVKEDLFHEMAKKRFAELEFCHRKLHSV